MGRKRRENLASRKSKRLEQYMSIISDINQKLFNENKYKDMLGQMEESFPARIVFLDGYDISDKWYSNGDIKQIKLWIKEAKGDIIRAYENWLNWAEYFFEHDRVDRMISSLHPATINSLPSIIPDFQPVDERRMWRDLERAYYDSHSDAYDMSFEDFMEFEHKKYIKFVQAQTDYHYKRAQQLKGLIEKQDVWPRGWMMRNKAIVANLANKKSMFPILNHLTNHALTRRDSERVSAEKKFSMHGEGRPYLLVKLNMNKMAEELGVSQDTVKIYARALKGAGVMKRLRYPWYGLGYYNRNNRVFFLKETAENKDFLATFTLK